MRTAIWMLSISVLKVAEALGDVELTPPMAIFLSILAAMCIVMDIYEFTKKYLS